MIVDDWQAGKLGDQPSLCRTLELNHPSPETFSIFSEQLRSILDRLYWRILRLEEEVRAMKERSNGCH